MFASRKMVMAIIAMGLATLGFIATGFSSLLAGQYAIFVGTISGIAGLFMASNISSQFVEKKGIVDQHRATVEAQAATNQNITVPGQPVEQIPPG